MTDHAAREIIRSSIRGMCREAGVTFTARPVIRSEPHGPATPEPEPLAAIEAAADLGRAATRAVSDHTRTAREDGRSWKEIGVAMGFADRPSLRASPVADRAFLAVASNLGNGMGFGWTCPSCLGVITDRGPEAGWPADAEHGHADGCKRLAETMRAYDASWGE